MLKFGIRDYPVGLIFCPPFLMTTKALTLPCSHMHAIVSS